MKENKKKVYLVTFNCECYLGKCAQIINDETTYDDIGRRMDFLQYDGIVSKDTTNILLTSEMNDLTIIDKETGQQIEDCTDVNGELYAIEDYNISENVKREDWVEKKLNLKAGNRYYIQGYQIRYGGTFTKKITFKIEAESDFDISKLSIIYDNKFDDLYWKINDNEAEGKIYGNIEPEEGLLNPYEIYYDGKRFKANSVRVDKVLYGESYMCFRWPEE